MYLAKGLRQAPPPAHSAGGHAFSAQHHFELWAFPKGGAPVSLGILPEEGTLTRMLTATQKVALANSSQVAVSNVAPFRVMS